ncbi:MAG: AMP-binding protein [Verrucomicrobiae bacterium]|nr:AMP-binding protein [Verrucomicrobiae bacterium]
MNATLSSESITGRFADAVARFATHTAISAPAGKWTYAELDRFSSRIAADILERLGDASEPVALLLDHDAPLIAAILGALKANKIYVALDPGQTAEQLAVTLASSGATLLLADEANLTLANSLGSGQVNILPVTETFSSEAPHVILPEISAAAGAWLMFTSGSTNMPKGVWQNHEGIVHETEVYAELTGLTPADRVSLLAACGLSASGGTLFATLFTGATLCLFHVRSQGVERLADWLPQERITVFHTVPTIFRHLARVAEGKNPLATLRLIRLGGEPVLPGDVETFRRQCPDGCRFMQSLSSTETGMISTFTMDKATLLENGRVPAGRAVRGVEIFLADENGRPVKNGEEGKITIRSARLRQGYWRQPELTAKKFKPDASDPRLRVFSSNDLGKFLPDGLLEHLGRADDLVKIHGQRVDLSEVEAALAATGLFAESAAAVIEDAAGERRLVGYLVPRPGADVSAPSCRRALRSSLPEHMVPVEFITLSHLPQTPGGKIDRRALPAPPARLNPKPGDRPRDRFEMKLAEIWQAVLRLRSIGMHDDFFELGGDSLRSVEVLVQIEEKFGVALTPSALAEHSTIAQLAAVVASHALARSSSPLITLRAAPAGRPLFLVHNGHGDVTTFARLARRLPGRPVYGLQSVGMDGSAWPLLSVPAMAKRYLEEIVKIDPTGPYLIAGTCMGGLIAFEMAAQLVRAGRPVAMVAVIVTPAPPYTGGRSHWHELLLDPVRDWIRMLRWAARRLIQPKLPGHRLPAYRHFIAGMNSRAGRSYRPDIYPGKLTVFTTTDASGLKEDRRQLMGKYARAAQTIALSCPNRLILSPPAVDELAKHFCACLEAAEAQP